MNSLILDGKRVRDEILAELTPRVVRLREAGRAPVLRVILAGDNAGSEIYVRNKVLACERLGIDGQTLRLPNSATTDDLLKVVGGLNADEMVDGILVQLPLPPSADASRVLSAVDPAKDVDGFHACNVGRLVANLPGARPCTPAGVMELFLRSGITVAGKRAVVVGRSDIVGKPMALLLLHANATVTICHSRTPHLDAVCREAEILVAAIGRPGFLGPDAIRDGAIVADVGINRIDDPALAQSLFAGHPVRLAEFERKRTAVVGDVHPSAYERSAAHTPVPGGVGPLTIALLMKNTVEAAERRLHLEPR